MVRLITPEMTEAHFDYWAGALSTQPKKDDVYIVSPAFAQGFLDDWSNFYECLETGDSAPRLPRVKMMCQDKPDLWSAIDNEDGWCWTEAFTSEEKAIRWLATGETEDDDD